MKPFVSVIIPTRHRPTFLLKAIKSVQQQTWSDVEIVVVIDGKDSDTYKQITNISDSRIKTVYLSENVGGSEARNIGIRHSSAEWIALLDDDDEWRPEKLEKQIKFAQLSYSKFPIVSCKFQARTGQRDYVWPRRLPSVDESIVDYIFTKSGLFHGEGIVQTSTILAPRELFLRIPFSKGLKKHQDWDWIISVSQLPDVKFYFVDEVLSTWNCHENANSVSKSNDWQFSLQWIKSKKSFVSKQAYASFLLTYIAPYAIRQKDYKAFLLLLSEACMNGKPSVRNLLLYLGLWIIPIEARQRLRAITHK